MQTGTFSQAGEDSSCSYDVRIEYGIRQYHSQCVLRNCKHSKFVQSKIKTCPTDSGRMAKPPPRACIESLNVASSVRTWPFANSQFKMCKTAWLRCRSKNAAFPS